MSPERGDSVERLLRDLAPRVLGAVARRHDDFAAAEDAVQDALVAAAKQWPRTGVPGNPGGWLYQVAVRRLTDQVRSDQARRRREHIVAGELALDHAPSAAAAMRVERDDTLVLLFMCCHPALTPASAIALPRASRSSRLRAARRGEPVPAPGGDRGRARRGGARRGH